MWEIYDQLIDAVPADLVAAECLIGLSWTLVRSRATGLAMTPREGRGDLPLAGAIAGLPVRRLAGWIKSWNFMEATVGMAAINSVLNTVQSLEELTGRPLAEQVRENAFARYREQVQGKKVAVVGHFPGLENDLAPVCCLTVLERRPQGGDLPDPACEYVLPDQNFVFITGTTLVNKTLPSLLELSRRAFVVLVGPSTPLAPVLFDYGVDVLATTVVTDPPSLRQVVQEGGTLQIFERGGRMVKVDKGRGTGKGEYRG